MAISQKNRPLRATLGDLDPETMLATRFVGTETMSRLYTFTLDIVAPVESPIKFKDVLGKPCIVEIDQEAGQTRFFHGIVNRFRQGAKDGKFIAYRAEIVPSLWLLTKQIRSRVFGPITVKDLLPAVIDGLYSPRLKELKAKYFPRNHTVQYRESDFSFLSRLMEEEGIYYYFTHTQDGHELVIADNEKGHDEIPAEMPLRFQDSAIENPPEGRITHWERIQQLRFGAVEYSDHTFEMPNNDLKHVSFPLDKLTVGTVEHDFTAGKMDDVSLVEFPGGYARFHDGIGPGGTEQPDDLEHLFEDNGRLANVRMDEEMVKALEIEGGSTYCRMTAGHKFTLADHFDADGDYVITQVSHTASCGVGDSGDAVDFKYANSFNCIPFLIPFRPARTTAKPFVQGTQTAVVVGGDGAEIEPDKYGRVKVLFRWDPEGNRELDSSCWVRVAQQWAGRAWGTQFIPRVGDEVIVAFVGGDPDQPIIIGSVYNADNMPIYTLPDNRTQSGIKTRSSKDGGSENYNELRFEDKKGEEQILIHAEKNMDTSVENNHTVSVGGGLSTASGSSVSSSGTSSTTVFGDTSLTVTAGSYTVTVKGQVDMKSEGPHHHITNPTEIKLTVGGSSITITPSTITLAAKHIVINGTADIKVTTPDMDMSGDKTVIHGKTMSVDGSSDAAYASSGGTCLLSGKGETTIKGSTIKQNC